MYPVIIFEYLNNIHIKKETQTNRPGRNLITFLIFANLYMWLWETMDAKAQGEYDNIQKKYYGEKVF